MPSKMSHLSYIWDITRPNYPVHVLDPPSPLCSLAFTPRSSELLVAGCHNGLVCLFDMRKGMYLS